MCTLYAVITTHMASMIMQNSHIIYPPTPKTNKQTQYSHQHRQHIIYRHIHVDMASSYYHPSQLLNINATTKNPYSKLTKSIYI